MTPQMKESLTEMANALEKLNRTLADEVIEMERSGMPPGKLEHVRAGVKAVKDCGNMLLVWTDYIARGDLTDPSADPEAGPDPFPR